MKKNLLLIVLLMTLIPLAGYSQNETSTQFTVAGVIVDATGEPLVGTAVYVKNEPGVGVVADLDGKFKIKVTKNATLIFQSVGMKNVEMLITKNEEKLKIVMKEDETKIDEVVVTGMSSQKKVSVVGAITTIDVAQLKTPANGVLILSYIGYTPVEKQVDGQTVINVTMNDDVHTSPRYAPWQTAE